MSSTANTSPRSSLSTVVGVIVIAAVGLMLAVWLRSGPVDSGALLDPAVGTPLNGLSFTPLVGAESKLRSSDLAGKVVLVNYWGTWCGYCRQEFPHIMELNDQFGTNPDFKLLSVSVEHSPQTDLEDIRSETAAYVERVGAAFPIYADPDHSNRDLYSQLTGGGISAVPQTILLDQQGVIRAVWYGYRPGYEDEMETLIAELLNGTSAEPAAE